MNWQARIEDALRPARLDDEILEELAQHAAATYASARAEGCAADVAERRTMQQIEAWASNPSLLRRRPRRAPAIMPPAGRSRGAAALAQDTRYAWRLLKRQPSYTALVVATMALGIAATTVIGSVAYGVLLKPLPWADAPRLVRLYEQRQGSTRRLRPMMTNAVYHEWERAHATLDALGAWSTDTRTLEGASERIKVGEVTPDLLPMLQAAPALGRTFAPGEQEPGRRPIIILSQGLWQQRFGGRADVLGASLRLDGTPYTVVGVMPASFVFPDAETRAWVPFHVPPVIQPGQQGFTVSMFQALGRLRPGVTPEQAAAEGTARGRSSPDHAVTAVAVFGSNGAIDVTAVPLLDAITRDVRPAILVLLVAVALLLVTAVANVTSLQLARATGRRREMAIRAALGAGRGRLVRQTLVENLLLGLVGGAAGLALAALMHRALPALLPVDFPRITDLAFGLPVQAFAIAVSIAAGLGCGAIPALHAARPDLVPALVEDSLAPVGGGLRTSTARIRATIMAGQVAIAAVLLIGALLLARSFIAMRHADLGYDAANTLSARVILPDADYSPERRLQAMKAIVERLAAAPGVSRVAFGTAVPFGGSVSLASFPLKKRDGTSSLIQTGQRVVSPGYFAAIGLRVREGREFAAQDSAAADSPVIVSHEFSRRYLEGKALGWAVPGAVPRPIVGVVDDTVRQGITDAPEPEMYSLVGRRPLLSEELYLVVRAHGDPRTLVPAVRSSVRETAPAAPLESIVTLEDRVTATLARPRLYAVLLGTFAAFALAIAAVGLFGVLSYTVAQRAREIGVRSALGAQVRDITALVFRQSLAIAAAGVALGLVASLWLATTLQRFLYGVSTHDAASFAAVGATLLVVAALASVVPARRAARVDPVKVLRG